MICNSLIYLTILTVITWNIHTLAYFYLLVARRLVHTTFYFSRLELGLSLCGKTDNKSTTNKNRSKTVSKKKKSSGFASVGDTFRVSVYT